MTNIGDIQTANEEAAQAIKTAGNYQAGEYSVADILKQKLTEAYGANKDIIENLDKSVQEYFSSPSAARVKYQDIWNPFQRESLVSQYTSNAALPMLSNANLLGSRMGGIENMISSAVGGYQATSARKQAQANAAQQKVQNLTNLYQLEEEKNKLSQNIVETNGRRYLISYDSQGNVTNKIDLGSAPASGGGGTGTFSERQLKNAEDSLTNDILNYQNLETVVKNYARSLDLYKIISIYDQISPYGKHNEPFDTILNWYAKGNATYGQLNPSNPAAGFNNPQ